MKFSVLMSVYKNESVSNFREAMDSVLHQTLLPDEIILMRDGPVPQELQKVINEYVNTNSSISYYPLEENQGLGIALSIGVEKAKYDYIGRMDTDDIAVPTRFEIQTKYMEEHPEVDVCGGQIFEFIDNTDNIAGKREVPLEHNGICQFMKRRNSFNHMTVMFKKNAVLQAGNYQDMYLVEDYYLWCRMLNMGFRFGNIDEVLVYARTNLDMYQRRGGFKYFMSWKMIEDYKRKTRITSLRDYLSTLTMRFVVQILIPNKLRGYILKTYSRKKQS